MLIFLKRCNVDYARLVGAGKGRGCLVLIVGYS